MMKKAEHNEELDLELITIQANIDDMNPEIYSYLIDLILKSGARDVYLTPIIMKKGRPGVLLNVLTDLDLLESMEDLIFRETTTLGLRYQKTMCHRLERKLQSVPTPWGKINAKIGLKDGKVINVAPEYQDCAAAAEKSKIPLKEIYDFVKQNINL